MWQLLEEDLVESPSLKPVKGGLPISTKPGLGFELDRDAVGRAAEAHRKHAKRSPRRRARDSLGDLEAEAQDLVGRQG
jgi:hypothetical protein